MKISLYGKYLIVRYDVIVVTWYVCYELIKNTGIGFILTSIIRVFVSAIICCSTYPTVQKMINSICKINL